MRIYIFLIALICSGCGRHEPGVQYIGLDDYTCATYRTGDDNHLVVNCYLTPTVSRIIR